VELLGLDGLGALDRDELLGRGRRGQAWPVCS
jgi:hypothetical protein